MDYLLCIWYSGILLCTGMEYKSCFCRPTIVRGDIAVDFSGRPAIRTSVCPFLVKVFLFANISVSIHRIAFIFYIQLPKDIGNTFQGYFCKNKFVFIVNLGVLNLEFFTKFWCFEIIGLNF